MDMIAGDSLSAVECYDPLLSRWMVAEAMSTMRSRVGVTVLNGRVLILRVPHVMLRVLGIQFVYG